MVYNFCRINDGFFEGIGNDNQGYTNNVYYFHRFQFEYKLLEIRSHRDFINSEDNGWQKF
jgi:hypothetical protein